MLNKKIIDICNLGLSEEKTITLIETAIADSKPYDHTNLDLRIACGVSNKPFDIDFSGESQSSLVQQIEKQFNKRELAFLAHHITWKVSNSSNHWLFGWLFKLLFFR